MDEHRAFRQRADIETHIMPDGSCLLFDPVSNEGHALNAAGTLVWDYCDGAHTAGQIADELATLLPQLPQARADALALLAGLRELGYLVEAPISSPAAS